MDSLSKLLYSAVGAAALFYFCVWFSLRYWKRRGVLHSKPNFLFGNLKGAFTKQHISVILDKYYKTYKGTGPFVGFFAFMEPMLFILDLELVHQIIQRNAELFAERNLYHCKSVDPLSMNLMQLDSKEWQNLRCKVNHCFASGQLENMLPALLRVAETYKASMQLRRNKNHGSINNLVDCWNVDVISSLVFGLDGDSLRCPENEFREKAHNCWTKFSLLKAVFAFQFPTLSRLLRFKFYDQETGLYFASLLSEKVSERKILGKLPNDYLQLFSDSLNCEDEKSRLTPEQFLTQLYQFIAIGLEACNSTLTFCLYELAHAPQIQEKAREEIEQIMQEHQNVLTMEALQEMSYLKQILYETLRLYTPHSFLLRKTLSNYEIRNSIWMLCEGQRIIIPIAAIHRDEQIYPEPLKFDPNRFEEDAIKKRPKSTFLPFGAWPRQCPAQNFVEMQMLVCLVTLLRQYKFSPCGDTQRPLAVDHTQLLLKPKDQITLLIEHLKSD